MFAVFNRAISRRSSCTLWRNSSYGGGHAPNFTREELELSTKLNILALFLVPLFPETQFLAVTAGVEGVAEGVMPEDG